MSEGVQLQGFVPLVEPWTLFNQDFGEGQTFDLFSRMSTRSPLKFSSRGFFFDERTKRGEAPNSTELDWLALRLLIPLIPICNMEEEILGWDIQ